MNKKASENQNAKLDIRVGEKWDDLDVRFEEARSRAWLSSALLALALLLMGIAAAFFVATEDRAGISGIADFSQFLVILVLFHQRNRVSG